MSRGVDIFASFPFKLDPRQSSFVGDNMYPDRVNPCLPRWQFNVNVDVNPCVQVLEGACIHNFKMRFQFQMRHSALRLCCV